MSEHQYVQQMDLFGRWIYSKGSLGTPEVLSFPYSWGDLGYEKCYTLLWLAQKLVSHHQTLFSVMHNRAYRVPKDPLGPDAFIFLPSVLCSGYSG